MHKINLFLIVFLFFAGCFLCAGNVLAYGNLRIAYFQKGSININNPETSQFFYDQLGGNSRDYFIDSDRNFELYINILVPESANMDGKYSAKVFLEPQSGSAEQQVTDLDGSSFTWQSFYEPNSRDYYLKGPELDKQLAPGKYKVEVSSADNQGKYVLVVGNKEVYSISSILNVCWQLPLLKISFLKTSILQFFLTYYGVGVIAVIGMFLILLALIYFFVGSVREFIKHNQAKTMLLTSEGMKMKTDIIKLLQKPAYDVTVAFITTAAKPKDNIDYVRKDWDVMRDEIGFNLEEFDIEGKTEAQVMKALELKDIIYVEGGDTFYLLKAMRACNFEKVIRKLLKNGKVYVGSSAGSIVAGRSIITSTWRAEFRGKEQNTMGLKDLRGLNLVPFNIFVHYLPEYEEKIKSKIKNPKKRAKSLKIITDDQAILVQGREVDMIGEGEATII